MLAGGHGKTRIQGRKRMKKTKKSQRKSNIELLRALLMFLVIILFQWKSLIFCLIPSNWFVVLFCVLYLVSVYVNPLFSVLSKKQLQQCIGICLALFVIYPTLFESGLSYLSGTSEWPGLGTVTMSGSAGDIRSSIS